METALLCFTQGDSARGRFSYVFVVQGDGFLCFRKGIFSMVNERLKKQLDFILEVDKTKNIFRRSLIHDGSRRENDAEHSWHIALMAFLFSEYSKDSDVDILKVMKMCLIHDIIEIDAGDTFCYDELGRLDK